MTKAISRVFMTAAATSIAFAPMAAQANTRAADASGCYVCSVAAQANDGDDDAAEAVLPNRTRPFRWLLAVAAASAATAGIIVASRSGNQSQGA